MLKTTFSVMGGIIFEKEDNQPIPHYEIHLPSHIEHFTESRLLGLFGQLNAIDEITTRKIYDFIFPVPMKPDDMAQVVSYLRARHDKWLRATRQIGTEMVDMDTSYILTTAKRNNQLYGVFFLTILQYTTHDLDDAKSYALAENEVYDYPHVYICEIPLGKFAFDIDSPTLDYWTIDSAVEWKINRHVKSE